MAVLGVIADDFTGATDIAGMLVKGGMRTIQTIGVPAKGMIPDDVDAVVVALKTRSIAAKDAVAQALGRPIARVLDLRIDIGRVQHPLEDTGQRLVLAAQGRPMGTTEPENFRHFRSS